MTILQSTPDSRHVKDGMYELHNRTDVDAFAWKFAGTFTRDRQFVVAYVDGSTHPVSLILNTPAGRRRAQVGDTVTMHADGAVTVAKTRAVQAVEQEALW